MNKRRESEKSKGVLLMTLIGALMLVVLVYGGDVGGSSVKNFYKKAYDRELNLLGLKGGKAEEENLDVEGFDFDYGTYEERESKVKVGSSDRDPSLGVFNRSLILNYPKDTPQVLIYYSHTGEGYYTGGDCNGDQRDNEKNVVAVGSELAAELEFYGIKVIHDSTIHDDINYNHSYRYSGKTVDKYLNEYGDIDLIIDIHRDAVSKKSVVTTTELNGKDVAQVMFVLDKSNNHLKDNSKVVSSLIDITEELFPSLLRPYPKRLINRTSDHFNQDKSKNALIIEVGAEFNTTEEAKETARYLGRIMAEYLYKKYSASEI